jgi:putative zinc finger/helix-turn-helix YgiT family protein
MRENQDTIYGLSCPECDSESVLTRIETQTFPYGRGAEQVMLSADVPVHECSSCGFVFTDARAEDIKHDAVCTHLGVLTPADVRTLRDRWNLSRGEFARLTKIGEASIARWESGALVQNPAMDQYLRLLAHDDVMQILLSRPNEADIIPIFKRLSPQEARTLRPTARRFALRK